MTDAGINDDISFLTKGSSGGQGDIALIDAKANGSSVFKVMGNGNVRIGNPLNPNSQYKLDVNGTIKTNEKVLASAYASNSPLIFEAPAGTERARIDDITGNMGIGTPPLVPVCRQKFSRTRQRIKSTSNLKKTVPAWQATSFYMTQAGKKYTAM